MKIRGCFTPFVWDKASHLAALVQIHNHSRTSTAPSCLFRASEMKSLCTVLSDAHIPRIGPSFRTKCWGTRQLIRKKENCQLASTRPKNLISAHTLNIHSEYTTIVGSTCTCNSVLGYVLQLLILSQVTLCNNCTGVINKFKEYITYVAVQTKSPQFISTPNPHPPPQGEHGEEGGGVEYSQLKHGRDPHAVPNPEDPNYSHFKEVWWWILFHVWILQ